jgi:hypothetical protein
MSNKAQEITGKVIAILDQTTGQGKKGQWVKQDFVIETPGDFPKKICLQAWNDKIDQIPEIGTEATVSYNPESREYNSKWYTDLRVWDIKVAGTKPAAKSTAKPKEPVKTGFNLASDDSDDLPF